VSFDESIEAEEGRGKRRNISQKERAQVHSRQTSQNPQTDTAGTNPLLNKRGQERCIVNVRKNKTKYKEWIYDTRDIRRMKLSPA
jgi:hypothetical protein